MRVVRWQYASDGSTDQLNPRYHGPNVSAKTNKWEFWSFKTWNVSTMSPVWSVFEWHFWYSFRQFFGPYGTENIQRACVKISIMCKQKPLPNDSWCSTTSYAATRCLNVNSNLANHPISILIIRGINPNLIGESSESFTSLQRNYQYNQTVASKNENNSWNFRKCHNL